MSSACSGPKSFCSVFFCPLMHASKFGSQNAVQASYWKLVYFGSPFLKSVSKNQNNILTHLTIKNENRPNPRTVMPKKILMIVAGDMICFVVGNKLGSAGVNNLVNRGLWSRLTGNKLLFFFFFFLCLVWKIRCMMCCILLKIWQLVWGIPFL